MSVEGFEWWVHRGPDAGGSRGGVLVSGMICCLAGPPRHGSTTRGVLFFWSVLFRLRTGPGRSGVSTFVLNFLELSVETSGYELKAQMIKECLVSRD
jgi:hypothetical protein